MSAGSISLFRLTTGQARDPQPRSRTEEIRETPCVPFCSRITQENSEAGLENYSLWFGLFYFLSSWASFTTFQAVCGPSNASSLYIIWIVSIESSIGDANLTPEFLSTNSSALLLHRSLTTLMFVLGPCCSKVRWGLYWPLEEKFFILDSFEVSSFPVSFPPDPSTVPSCLSWDASTSSFIASFKPHWRLINP